MGDNQQRLGAIGESIAADYLTTLGWHLCARNWRTRYGELDLIAREPHSAGADTLVIAEVKTRRDRGVYDDPVAAVTDEKLDRMAKLAWMWVAQARENGDLKYFRALRFDVISIRMDGESGAPVLRHHRGVLD